MLSAAFQYTVVCRIFIGDESVTTSFVILTSFLPALTVLILCKISREGWDNLMILPNIKKAWKIYLFAIAGTLVMNYLNELLMYLMFRGEVSFQAGIFTLRGLREIFGMTVYWAFWLRLRCLEKN